MSRHDELVAALRASGYRITPQRLAIAGIIAEDSSHPTVEQVFDHVAKRFPTTSLATVYKTLDTLRDVNEVHELDFSDGRRYGAATKPHAHLVCRNCGAVEDHEFNIPRLIKRADEQSTFTVTDARVDFYGLCAACQGS